MQKSPILSPRGEPVFTAGGEKAHNVFEHKGFVVSLEWVGDHRRAQPCMVIWKAPNVFTGRDGKPMWVIGRRAITEFVGFNKNDKCSGLASEHCQREAKEALPVLGFDINDKEAHTALVDCVVKFSEALVRMPPAPPKIREEFKGAPMWDVAVKKDGKTTNEASV
jgi:hypothetical protein